MEFSSVQSLLRLILIEDSLPSELRFSINLKAIKFLDDLNKQDFGNCLYTQLFLDYKHTEECARALVQRVPAALSYRDEWNEILIDSAAMDHCSVFLVPMLAEEGLKNNVGGEGMRGGLLCRNGGVLRDIAGLEYDKEDYEGTLDFDEVDSNNLDVIKRLRGMGLLQKEDIRNYGLLLQSSIDKEISQRRFHYFVDWEPSNLKIHWQEGTLLCFRNGEDKREEYQMFLTAALRHYPDELGLLLLKNNYGETPFQLIRGACGDEGWEIVTECLDRIGGDTNLYQLMFAAAGNSSELDLVYHLLRRNPAVQLLC